MDPRHPGRHRSLVVLCRANLIRSPLAAALLRRELLSLGRTDLGVTSAGLEVTPGAWPGAEAIEVAQERGVDLHRHRPVAVTGDLLDQAGMVLTMTENQRAATGRLSRSAIPKTFTIVELARLLSTEVAPPIETWGETARRAHRLRPLIPPALEREDVPDPVGHTVYYHQVVADTLVGLVSEIAGHVVPIAARGQG
ncbi:arsenate reductase/protein-tyrosine-phosphatase family protein [Nocardioides sp. Soil805]|uniref:arsenate reductase/protein-tyrosine-phosphatase family protein n=1 Tax=Nocardioides sp. Soil805 TaxID=1736416 RepID=UPI0007027828|nr:hypothetical protein [Nocardioides sp. Soil805]KRF36856.1 hypothetical protein ASG94_05510 [Nocardioides sp. Soil805]